ncbi:putative microtubule binding protein [Rosellinia necatrix]|uniref:Putative microtubule binding protein n=1 Tax=Rosellinia necatrix TaxID=77044 RepID=A0A1W2TKY1_ROSNE|nr:putative microtubule binding protein [Rosellinia necatrix]
MIPSMNLQATHMALLEWANAMIHEFAPEREATLKAKKLEHLFDAAFFSALLKILDPAYDPTRLEESLKAGGETRRSMHVIHKSLIAFSRRECSKIDPMIKLIDFQALDRDPTRVGVSEVLLVFLCGACFHSDNNRYIQLVQGLDAKHQSSIFRVLSEVDERFNGDTAPTDSDTATTADTPRTDADLAHEAAIADLQREAEEAKRQAGGLRLRLDRLQDNYDELVRKHEELQDENEHLHKQIESEAGNFDRHRLQRHLKENEALIANLENERNALMEDRERLLKDKARLEAMAQKAELLIDENQELKARNEELSKKANMADNLRKKVEASKHLEAELSSLRNDRMDLAKTYDQLTHANSKIETLKRESEAYASKMQGYEIDIANMRDQKLALVSQNQDMMIRLGELEQRSQLDEAVVRDLQEKVLMLDPSAVMDDPLAGRPTSLEDELNDSGNTVTMRNLEVQRLQAENAVLKSTIGSETDKGQLVQEMEDLRASRQAIQEKYNDMLEKHTVGQKQIDSLIQNLSGKGEEAYSNLRTQVLAEQSRSKHFERQNELLKEQLADKERALLEARGDFAAVEKSSLDALTELKHTDGMIAVSLRAELEVERRRYKLLKDESEAMQKQLLSTFIEKDELRREAEQANRELQKAADGQTVSTDFIKQSEKMEKLRTRYKQLQQQFEQSDLKNRELERTLRSVRNGSEASAQKAQTDEIIKNLQRENAMIATAWYDLSSRLQSNHFVLQRRNDAAKSWLNRQRQLVNLPPRR